MIAHRLIQGGVLLFLLGLLNGFVIPIMAAPRLGLSSHMEGVMNGTILIVLGLIWPQLQMSQGRQKFTSALLLYGTYVNWFTVLLAGVWGAGSEMMPLAGGGHTGSPVQEALIKFGLISLSLAMTVAFVLILIGLRKAHRT